jgi:hypothetical protein
LVALRAAELFFPLEGRRFAAAIAAIDKINYEGASLVVRKARTFLGTNGNLEVVFDATAKCFQPSIIVWERNLGVFATCIGYGIESSKGELCEERMIDEPEVVVERKLVLLLVFVLGTNKEEKLTMLFKICSKAAAIIGSVGLVHPRTEDNCSSATRT